MVGIHKFSFGSEEVRTNNGRRISFLKLIIESWPGDWRVQLAQVNRLIGLDNEKKRKQSRTGKVGLTKEMAEQEFWVFWGITLSAGIDGEKGTVCERGQPEEVFFRRSVLL